MLTYNNIDKFEKCIHSMTPFFYHQSVKEIIILDNGSNGQMIDFLGNLDKNIVKLKVIYSSKNLGVAKGRKILFQEAKGDYIISLDSDVVIEDHQYLLNTMINNLKPLPWEETFSSGDVFLLGGGGGNHPHFPSVFTHDVIQIPAREKKNEFLIVGEVAGWCHCFRRALLEKVIMDENFSPFWGEDSDFCIQINKLGGKMAIFGKGVIKHSFSTCRDYSRKKEQDIQWEKILTKWCPVKEYMDVEWYKKYYQTETPIQDYLTGDILLGRLNPEIIKFFGDDQKIDLDSLIKLYFTVKNCSLPGSGIINIVNPKTFLDISLDNVILVMTEKEYNEIKIPKNIKCRKIILNIDVPQDPYVLMLMVIHTLSYKDFEEINLIGYDLPEFNLSFNRKGIRKYIRNGEKPITPISSFSFPVVKKSINSYPVKDVLRAHLLIPYDYSNTWCPEYSPRHIISELFLRVYVERKNWEEEERDDVKHFLTIVINDDGDLDTKKIRKHSHLMYLSTDYCLSHLPDGVDYFYQMEDYSLIKLIEKLGEVKMSFIYDYDYLVIFDNRKYKIDRDLNEFYQRGKYQNQIMIKDDLSLFSFSIDDFEKIEKMAKFFSSMDNKKVQGGKSINSEKSFNQNFTRKIFFSEIWKLKKEKSGDDEIISYYRDDERGEVLIDFPLCLK